jgi:hypothetical protein
MTLGIEHLCTRVMLVITVVVRSTRITTAMTAVRILSSPSRKSVLHHLSISPMLSRPVQRARLLHLHVRTLRALMDVLIGRIPRHLLRQRMRHISHPSSRKTGPSCEILHQLSTGCKLYKYKHYDRKRSIFRFFFPLHFPSKSPACLFRLMALYLMGWTHGRFRCFASSSVTIVKRTCGLICTTISSPYCLSPAGLILTAFAGHLMSSRFE